MNETETRTDVHKVLMAYDNCYFNGAMCCVICGERFEGGGIQFGFELIPNGKIHSEAAVCPRCMKLGVEGWRQKLRERGEKWREYAKVAAQQALEEAERLEALATEEFLLPTDEEEKAIRAEFPGEWLLSESEETPQDAARDEVIF